MNSRSKKGSKRRYVTAGDVLADIPSPAIARRLTVKPLSTLSGAKRVLAKTPMSVRSTLFGDKPALPKPYSSVRRKSLNVPPHKATTVIARAQAEAELEKIEAAYIREMNGENRKKAPNRRIMKLAGSVHGLPSNLSARKGYSR